MGSEYEAMASLVRRSSSRSPCEYRRAVGPKLGQSTAFQTLPVHQASLGSLLRAKFCAANSSGHGPLDRITCQLLGLF